MKSIIIRFQVKQRLLHDLLLFSRSVVSDSPTASMDCTHQAPWSIALPRQEYWSGLEGVQFSSLKAPKRTAEASLKNKKFYPWITHARGSACHFQHLL